MRWSWLIILGSAGVVACTVDVSALRGHARGGDGGVLDVAHEVVINDAAADPTDGAGEDVTPGSGGDVAGDAPGGDALADMMAKDDAAIDTDAFTVPYDTSGNTVDGVADGPDAGGDAQPDSSVDNGGTSDSLAPDANDARGADANDAFRDLPSDAKSSEDGFQDGVLPETDAKAALFCDPGDRTLAACYRFEGNMLDESSYAQATSVTGASYQQGVAGQALHLGSGSSVTVAESTSLDFTTAMTIELWVRPASLPSGSGRAALVDNNGQYGLFIYAGGDVTCTTSGSSATAGQAVAVNRWTHLACVFDGNATTLKVHVDGVLRATENDAPSSLNTGSRDGTAIGRNNPSGDTFYGEIDGMRIWNVVRPASLLCTTQATCG